LIFSTDKTCASLLGFNSTSKLRIIRGIKSFAKLSQCLSIPDLMRTLLLQKISRYSKIKQILNSLTCISFDQNIDNLFV
jgi:hypothetical protein